MQSSVCWCSVHSTPAGGQLVVKPQYGPCPWEGRRLVPSLGIAKTNKLQALFVNSQSLIEDKWHVVASRIQQIAVTVAHML